MKTIKTRALVLREYEAGESDKRLLLLCKGYGRLFVYARGARKPKSKFMAAAQLFTYADMVIGEGRGFFTLNQASIIESFYNLRADYDALCCAHVVTEICEKSVLENEDCDALLQLTLKTLNHLSKNTLPPIQVLSVYMLRFFLWYGVAPQLTGCCICGKEDTLKFCAEGLLCCPHTLPHITLSPPTLAAMRHIFEQDLSKAFLFNAAEPVIQELKNTAEMLWRCHFEWELRSFYSFFSGIPK